MIPNLPNLGLSTLIPQKGKLMFASKNLFFLLQGKRCFITQQFRLRESHKQVFRWPKQRKSYRFLLPIYFNSLVLCCSHIKNPACQSILQDSGCITFLLHQPCPGGSNVGKCYLLDKSPSNGWHSMFCYHLSTG